MSNVTVAKPVSDWVVVIEKVREGVKDSSSVMDWLPLDRELLRDRRCFVDVMDNDHVWVRVTASDFERLTEADPKV